MPTPSSYVMYFHPRRGRWSGGISTRSIALVTPSPAGNGADLEVWLEVLGDPVGPTVLVTATAGGCLSDARVGRIEFREQDRYEPTFVRAAPAPAEPRHEHEWTLPGGTRVKVAVDAVGMWALHEWSERRGAWVDVASGESEAAYAAAWVGASEIARLAGLTKPEEAS